MGGGELMVLQERNVAGARMVATHIEIDLDILCLRVSFGHDLLSSLWLFTVDVLICFGKSHLVTTTYDMKRKWSIGFMIHFHYPTV